MDFALRQTVFEHGAPMPFAIFPELGWFSHLIRLGQGDAGEVGLVGREGMIGLPFLFGDDRSATEIIVQGAGRGLRLDVGAFRQVMSENPALHARLLRYALHSRPKSHRPRSAMHATTSRNVSRDGS